MKEYIGPGSITDLSRIIEKENAERIFLVTGKASYELSGAQDKIEAMTEGKTVTRFNDFTPNPKVEDIAKGIELYNKQDYDMIVAVGGGSAIDVAKAINIISANNGTPEEIVANNAVTNPGKPFVAIPTTSGSGSEATHFAVVYIGKKKYSLAHKEYILPDYCIVDADLTESNPPGLTAASGMDAFCQAVEGFWSVNSNEESRNNSRQAIVLVMGNLEQAVNNPDTTARENMALAAHLAGKSINIAKTTASHAMSYLITGLFGVPHGHAVGMTLGKVLVYNATANTSTFIEADDLQERMTELYGLLGVSTPQEADEKITNLMKSIGLETSLSKVGATEAHLEELASNVNIERLKNNPREFTKDALKDVLRSVF